MDKIKIIISIKNNLCRLLQRKDSIMKKKYLLLLSVLIIIGLIVYWVFNHISITKNNSYMDYTPAEEISESESRQTTVLLYFLDSQTNQLKSEGKLLNSNELLKNPYKLIVEKLIEGPNDENLQKVLPENTKIIDANLSNDCVILNFSEEILNYKDDTQKFNIINSLLNTLTQFNEVNTIKILVNNEANDKISQEYTSILENT